MFAIELQAVYLRGTTYLRTPLFGIIPVVTLSVVCAGAVTRVARFLAAKYGRLLSIRDVRQGHDAIPCTCVCLFSLVAPRSQLNIIDQVEFLTCN